MLVRNKSANECLEVAASRAHDCCMRVQPSKKAMCNLMLERASHAEPS